MRNVAPANLIGSYRLDAVFAGVSAALVLIGGVLIAYVFAIRNLGPAAVIVLAVAFVGYNVLRTVAVDRLHAAQAGARAVERAEVRRRAAPGRHRVASRFA